MTQRTTCLAAFAAAGFAFCAAGATPARAQDSAPAFALPPVTGLFHFGSGAESYSIPFPSFKACLVTFENLDDRNIVNLVQNAACTDGRTGETRPVRSTGFMGIGGSLYLAPSAPDENHLPVTGASAVPPVVGLFRYNEESYTIPYASFAACLNGYTALANRTIINSSQNAACVDPSTGIVEPVRGLWPPYRLDQPRMNFTMDEP